VSRSAIASKAMKLQKTKDNMEIVASSLASYLANNKRLPKPSYDRSGIESEDANCAVGMVPHQTLGISEKNTLDGNAKPFIYIVEPKVTISTTIYDDDGFDDGRFNFCKNILFDDQKIEIKNQQKSFSGDVIVFVVDTADNPPQISGNKIIITPSSNTVWIRRDLFLTRYLKLMPCASHMEMTHRNAQNTQMRTDQTQQQMYNPFDSF
jgi:hypothetical protein